MAVTYWICIELFVLTFITFKRYTGVYFWSILLSTIGVILSNTGFFLTELPNPSTTTAKLSMIYVGYVLSQTGSALVIWARLHLVLRDRRILKGVLILIIVEGIVCHPLLIAFTSLLVNNFNLKYFHAVKTMEFFNMFVFAAQETLLSGLYIFYTARFLGSGYDMHTRKVIGLLVLVQVLVIGLECIKIAILCLGLHIIEGAICPLFIAIKLQCEFIVLNQLQALVKRGDTRSLGQGLGHWTPKPEPSSEGKVGTLANPLLGFTMVWYGIVYSIVSWYIV
jgi:hypothetical protein